MSSGQRNALLGVIGILALGAVGIIAARGGRGTAGMPTDYGIQGVCLSCKAESKAAHALGEYAPFKCTACDKSAVYPWFFCRNCQKRFVPELVRPEAGGPLRLPMGARCPGCGSNDVQQWDPAMPGQENPAAAPLPAWKE